MTIPTLNYTNATVIHTNKYNQRSGFMLAWIFLNNVVLDVVFRIDETGEEFSTSYINPNTILYPQQKIVLVSVDDKVIAYIDNAAGKYYYLNNSLTQVLSYSININWALLIILTFVFFIMLQQFLGVNNEYSLLIFFIPVALWIYEKIMSGYIEAAVDKEIEKYFA